MDKMKMESPNLTEENIEKIGKLFPNALTEMRDEEGNLKKGINFEILKQELSGDVIDGEECYDFTWVGKKASIVEANTPIRKTLRPCLEESKDWENTENLYIEGDNLDVLKLLQESYLNSVKMVYIDPPYNTGNDSFVYTDRLVMDEDEYEEGIEYRDEEGNINFKQNNETNPRFHSDWCSMMYSRLKLAHTLLREDGVIFISIDDNELHNLRKICDEVFGADNYINIISAKMKNIAGASGGGEDKRLKKNIEYIIIYVKDYNYFTGFDKVYNYTFIGDLLAQYKDENISWKYTSVITDFGEKEYLSSTVDGDGSEIKIFRRKNPKFSSVAKLSNEENMPIDYIYYKYFDRIFTTAMPQSSIRKRVYEEIKSDLQENGLYSIEYVPRSGKNKGKLYEQFYRGKKLRLFSWFKDVAEIRDNKVYKKDLLGTYWGKINLNNLTKEGQIFFDNGKKPMDLLTKIVSMSTNEDSIVLDFFSGSATTAHAVNQINSEGNGNRKYIMVQLPEIIDEKNEAYKAGFKNISEIGKERIRRAGEKIKKDNKDNEGIDDLDIGFRVLKVDSTNMKDVYYAANDIRQDRLDDMVSNIKGDRTDLDLLYGVLLDWGLPLSLKHEMEEINGVTVHTVDQGSLIACFADKVPETVVREIAKRQPLRVVFRDSSFGSSPEKINVEEIFKLLAPNTSVKVI